MKYYLHSCFSGKQIGDTFDNFTEAADYARDNRESIKSEYDYDDVFNEVVEVWKVEGDKDTLMVIY